MLFENFSLVFLPSLRLIINAWYDDTVANELGAATLDDE